MIDDPTVFPWSSCASHCGADDPLISHHHAYMNLGATTTERTTAYRALLQETLPDELLQEIRAYLQQQRALGRDDFRAMVEARTQRFAGIRPAHRPPNSSRGK